MIYTIGYYIAVIGLVIMMFGFKSFYSQMNKKCYNMIKEKDK